jgi:hypothetical protein
MSEKHFSHVCTACRAPTLVQGRKEGPIESGVLVIAAIIAGLVVFSLLERQNIEPFVKWILVIGVAGAGVYVWRLWRTRRARTCPSCAAVALIPVASPEGIRIMKEAGYVES